MLFTKLVIIFFTLSLLPAQIFKLQGWEYEKKLNINNEYLKNTDNTFLNTISLNNNIYVFIKSENSLYFTIFKNESITSEIKKISDLDKSS